MTLNKKQIKNSKICIFGLGYVGLPLALSFGKHFKVILSDKNGKHLFVPRGFAHGILGLDRENILHYACSNYRDPKSEVSIKWNDPDLNINWGTKKPIISKKDKFALSLRDFREIRK